MNINMGRIDRGLRLVLAVVLMIAAFSAWGATWAWLALTGALIMALTAISGFCPLYRVIGLRTCRRD